jgi:hypothetical protein
VKLNVPAIAFYLYLKNKTTHSLLRISVRTFSKAFPCKELQIFVTGFERLFVCFIVTMLFWFIEQSEIIVMIFVQVSSCKIKTAEKKP